MASFLARNDAIVSQKPKPGIRGGGRAELMSGFN